MSSQRDQLQQITDDLKTYIDQFCSTTTGASDPSGEKCNDAHLMLQQALSDIPDK
jgi:hypothetical protein